MPAPIYELVITIGEGKLKQAFKNATDREKQALNLCGQLYAAAEDPTIDTEAVINLLRTYVPDLPVNGTPQQIAAYAEGKIEGDIIRRFGVEKEFREFLKKYVG
ncbi:MAG: hypothetical protein JRC60_08600 [Deltaproteobacteria bacterium]|nr:hypothetical protein [Deltaproteobacteria bacterium]